MDLEQAMGYVRTRRNGILVTTKRDGRPQLSNIVYAVVDDVALISITADRAKYRNMRRDPLVSLYVGQDDFGGYVVLEGDAELSPVAADPHDATVEELITVYRTVIGEHPDWDDFRRAMVADQRVVVRLAATYAYGMPLR